MSAWLAPMWLALDARERQLEVFFRDDDAGWCDGRLFQLLDLFEEYACPVDLAVIPAAVTDSLASALLARRQAGCRVGFHQHGFSHDNHEPHGRPCEFGPSRPAALQCRDVAEGHRRLKTYFAEYIDPIFTPPWNRCSVHTGRGALASGLRAISCDITAPPLGVSGLAECPVHIDWFAKSNGRRLDRPDWAVRLARQVANAAAPLGIMLHHAEMDAAELEACEQVVRTLCAHPAIVVLPMSQLAVTS